MSDETTLIASHKADEGKRARAKTKTKEKQASALRAKMFLETKVEICRFHVSNMAGRSEVVVSGRQKNCKRIVRGASANRLLTGFTGCLTGFTGCLTGCLKKHSTFMRVLTGSRVFSPKWGPPV